jgi:membrane protein DedA with SNARE-associated domain
MLSHLTDTLTTLITNLYITTGLLGIVIAMALESCCIPLPSEIVMPLAGIMIASGKILHGTNTIVALILVALAGAIGCLIGSIAAYGIGYRGGRPLMLKYGRYLLISQHDADRADAFFHRWGSATAFFSRLLPVVRTYISLPAGISKMPFVKFCVYTFLGSFPWCIVLAFLGIQLGNHLDTLAPIFHSLDIVILVVLVILVALYIWRHIRNDNKARTALTESNNVTSQDASSQVWNQQNALPQSQGQYGQQPRQFQPTGQPNWQQPSIPQQPFPQQQDWPPTSDDRTVRR